MLKKFEKGQTAAHCKPKLNCSLVGRGEKYLNSFMRSLFNAEALGFNDQRRAWNFLYVVFGLTNFSIRENKPNFTERTLKNLNITFLGYPSVIQKSR